MDIKTIKIPVTYDELNQILNGMKVQLKIRSGAVTVNERAEVVNVEIFYDPQEV